MSKLLISTQYHENYGSAADPYWKAKGGSVYVVNGLDFDEDYEWSKVRVEQILAKVRDQVEISNPMCEEYIIGWTIVADDFLTEYERAQLEYDGIIAFPSKELIVDLDTLFA